MELVQEPRDNIIPKPIFLARSEILKDEALLHGLCNERWSGNKISTGDDCFLSRWMLVKGWRFYIQDATEADMATLVPDDHKLILQNVRWLRSTYQHALRVLFDEPGVREFSRTHPYCCRKLVECLLGSLINGVHAYAWVVAFQNSPMLALAMLVFYVYKITNSYRAFIKKYPFCRKKIWAAFLMDWSYLILSPYSLLTISKEGWMTRREDHLSAISALYSEEAG